MNRARPTWWPALLLLVALTELSGSAAIKLKAPRREPAPRVGIVIPTHPPRYSYLGRFLEQYAACPAARRAMSVVVVFSNEENYKLFKEGIPLFGRDIPDDSWTPIISKLPGRFSYMQDSQQITSWKKFIGLAHMMDQRPAPDYGIIADSEMVLYDEHDCGARSKWNTLLPRIQELERRREWPAQKITETDAGSHKMVTVVMKQVRRWVVGNESDDACSMPSCDTVKKFEDDVTFSWWTDIPWMNLNTTARLFTHMMKREKRPNETWRSFVYPAKTARYDHIAYQLFTILYEGFTYRNVTDITGETYGMGTYLEAENRNSSRVAELKPMWVSDRVLHQTQEPTWDRFGHYCAKLPAFSEKDPPLLVVHTDVGKRYINERKNIEWEFRVNHSRILTGSFE